MFTMLSSSKRSKKRYIAGDCWRVWIRTRMPGGIMLAAKAPGEAMKALIDLLIMLSSCNAF